MTNERIVIVGGGIAGLSTAWHLARSGARDVVVVERERALGRHATAQNAAILRTPMPDAISESFARESAEFLRRPPGDFASRPLLDPCGVILACAARSAAAEAWEARLATRAEDEVRALDAHDLARLAPHFEARGQRAWLIANEGRIDIAALVEGYERGARQLGVRFELGARVVRIAPSARAIELADGRTIQADRVVIAAGAWAEELGRAIGSHVTLRPTRRHLLVTRSDVRVDPAWPVLWTDDDAFYARPEAGGLMLSPCDEVDVVPSELAATIEELAVTRAKCARHMPGFASFEIARFWAGIRTHGPDERFVIGPDPDVASLFWVAGLGGHGMTCSHATGALASQWLIAGSTSHPLAPSFDPSRSFEPQH